jgi:hypothetical protein
MHADFALVPSRGACERPEATAWSFRSAVHAAQGHDKQPCPAGERGKGGGGPGSAVLHVGASTRSSTLAVQPWQLGASQFNFDHPDAIDVPLMLECVKNLKVASLSLLAQPPRVEPSDKCTSAHMQSACMRRTARQGCSVELASGAGPLGLLQALCLVLRMAHIWEQRHGQPMCSR